MVSIALFLFEHSLLDLSEYIISFLIFMPSRATKMEAGVSQIFAVFVLKLFIDLIAMAIGRMLTENFFMAIVSVVTNLISTIKGCLCLLLFNMIVGFMFKFIAYDTDWLAYILAGLLSTIHLPVIIILTYTFRLARAHNIYSGIIAILMGLLAEYLMFRSCLNVEKEQLRLKKIYCYVLFTILYGVSFYFLLPWYLL